VDGFYFVYRFDFIDAMSGGKCYPIGLYPGHNCRPRAVAAVGRPKGLSLEARSFGACQGEALS